MGFNYSNEHVWLKQDAGQIYTVGITAHAQETLGDVVFVELPELGKHLSSGDVAGVVESVKAAADVFMPASGKVTAVNEALRDDPALANSDPLNAGWFFKIELDAQADLSHLMDQGAYDAFLASGA
jgi:glycine cleavage system H protein